MRRDGHDPRIPSLDGLAREDRQASPDTKVAMAEHSLRLDLRDGPSIMGRSERHRDDPESFVRHSSHSRRHRSHFQSFQEIQHLSALQAALRFLPNVIIGIMLNLATGLLVHRLHANHLVLVTTILSAGSPLLMAVIDPKWSWWYCAFWAVLLAPVSADGNYFPSLSLPFSSRCTRG